MITTIWHFKDNEGFEDYALSEEERDEMQTLYQAAGAIYSMTTIVREEEEE